MGAAGVLATAHAANAYGSMGWGEETKTTRTPKAPPVSCPAGERYAHIKIGGLLFKKTAFKGCGTPIEIAYWERQKQADMNRRWQNFAQGLANGAKAYGDSMQNSAPTYTTCNTRLNGFGGASSTCYSY